MKLSRSSLALAVTAGLLAATAANASDAERFGTLATGMPYDREIRLSAQPRAIGVWRMETIRFVTGEGREFRWRFDTARGFDRFPLASIAPKELNLAADATIYVNGELPISGDH